VLARFRCRYLGERDHLEELGVDGRIIFKYFFSRTGMGGVDWIVVAQGRGRWLALLSAGKNFRVP